MRSPFSADSPFLTTALVSTALAILCSTRASALIVDTRTSDLNTSDPGTGVPWNNVFQYSDSSAVYLGNGWFVTAVHINPDPGSVVINGLTYNTGSSVIIQNSGTLTTPNTDIQLIQITGTNPLPSLPSITIATGTLPVGGDVTLIGYGLNRSGTGPTYDPIVVSSSAPALSGFNWDGTSDKSWGLNERNGSPVAAINVGTGDTLTFQVTFNNLSGTANEAQAARFDSGGGVFYDNAGTWELVGLMHAVDGFSNQNANTAAFGNVTYISVLGDQGYREQILAAIPEPSTSALFAAGLTGALYFTRRRKQ